MTELVDHATAYEIVEEEPPELLGKNLVSAGHLWAATTAFFFIGFVFAFFYLRSLNNAHMWHPKGVNPPIGLGTAIFVCMLVSAALTWLGLRERRAAVVAGAYASRFDDARLAVWRWCGLGALALGVAAIVLQCVEYGTLGFGPTQGGLASVFVGWTGLYAVFLVGAMFWLETLLATSFRHRGRRGIAPGTGSADPHREGSDIRDPHLLDLPSLEALTFFYTVLAVIGTLAYILLYAVK